MKNGLKIYACSGLNLSEGVGTSKEEFNYWLDNTSTIYNTCAINSCILKNFTNFVNELSHQGMD